jgi:hypothetical protein
MVNIAAPALSQSWSQNGNTVQALPGLGLRGTFPVLRQNLASPRQDLVLMRQSLGHSSGHVSKQCYVKHQHVSAIKDLVGQSLGHPSGQVSKKCNNHRHK